jgi:hypothetical protein
MKNRICLVIAGAFFVFNFLQTGAQLSPQDAIKSMGRGINMGNTLDPPNEGDWGNPLVVEANFDDYKNAGFTCVRIPVTWDKHTSGTSPYTINAAWLDRVEQIIDWGLSKKLIIIINAHHDGWIKENYTDANKARFDSIWSQIATRFKDKSDSLLFEIINEPYPLSLENVNDLNARTLSTIRKTNPTRIVLFSGHMWSNSSELIQAAIPADDYLIGYYHSYDPYPFGLEGPGTYGSDADIAATVAKFEEVSEWGTAHTIPVVLSEFGYIKDCSYNSRMCAYATVTEKALLYNVAFNAWDDGGDFKFYNRNEHTWNEIKDILINTYTVSPYKMIINNFADTLVNLQWTNRTTENDSIIIERRINNSSFEDYRKVAPETSEIIDSATSRGNTYYYRLKANLKDSIEIQSYPVRIVNVPVNPAPYSGTAIAIPGTLEAENFDLGIERQTYHDSDPLNLGGMYRPGVGVDIYKKGVVYYIGDVEAGEWLDYTVKVADEGDYIIAAYMGAVTAGGRFELECSSDTVPFTAEASGSLETFIKIENTVHLAKGTQTVRIRILQTPEFTMNKLIFASVVPVDDLLSEGVSIYPNPAVDQITIKGINGTAVIAIYDIGGSLKKSARLDGNNNTVTVNMLKDGVYILKFTTTNRSICSKFIKTSKH